MKRHRRDREQTGPDGRDALKGIYIPRPWGKHPDDSKEVTHARTTPPKHMKGIEPAEPDPEQ